MANNVFYFFYAPTWDWPPEGPIKLGNVLTSVEKPERPLYTAPLPDDSDVYSSEKTDVQCSRERLREGKFSILTKFFSVVGVGVDIGAWWKNGNDEAYMFKRIETRQFVPKDDYVQKCIEAEAVRRYLDRARYRKPVYLVTGVKTVYGARAKSHVSGARGSAAAVTVDNAVWSGGNVPVRAEPGIGGKTETKQGMSWEGSSDFVFAFRVRKVRVKKTQAVDDHEDYKKGAMLGDDARKTREALPELLILSQEDAKAEEEGYDGEALMEGDGTILCAVRRADQTDDEEDHD